MYTDVLVPQVAWTIGSLGFAEVAPRGGNVTTVHNHFYFWQGMCQSQGPLNLACAHIGTHNCEMLAMYTLTLVIWTVSLTPFESAHRTALHSYTAMCPLHMQRKPTVLC